jgi:hypothetical protein
MYPPIFDGSFVYTDNFQRALATIQDVTIICNTRYLAQAMVNRAYGRGSPLGCFFHCRPCV